MFLSDCRHTKSIIFKFMSELIEFHKRFTYKDSELSDSEIERRIVALSDFLIAQQVFLKTVKFRSEK